jgi:hypothetical protein
MANLEPTDSKHTQMEKISVCVHENADYACLRVASEMAELIRSRVAANHPSCVMTQIATHGHWPAVSTRRQANAYDALGLAEYEAIEAFKRWLPKL